MGTTGRLVKSTEPSSPAINVTILDGAPSRAAFSRCDDGSDNTFVSARFAEADVLQRKKKFWKNSFIHLSVAFNDRLGQCLEVIVLSNMDHPTDYTALLGRSAVSCERYILGCCWGYGKRNASLRSVSSATLTYGHTYITRIKTCSSEWCRLLYSRQFYHPRTFWTIQQIDDRSHGLWETVSHFRIVRSPRKST